jgi:dTDP-4-amino-4,6-dideoxygalactose transaminase
MKVSFSYLPRQFEDPDPILADIRELVVNGKLTLGEPVQRFERAFAEFIGVRHAIGVGSGTDALFLALKAFHIGPGDEVITAANTFVATAGAIATTGARVVFVDCNERYVLDPDKLEAAITPRTRAIMPVHYTGQPVDMAAILAIADHRGLKVIEDACTAVDGAIADGRRCGSIGAAAGFSFHPLKNLNIWGDGGMITTNDDQVHERLLLLRNHGMMNRDQYAFYAYNSRLDTIQAAVGLRLLPAVSGITNKRIDIARRYDTAFAELAPAVRIPPRNPQERHVFHLYMLLVDRRDALLAHLKERGISAKVHYPIPLHLQPASAHLGYARGDFPVAEGQVEHLITLPAHQHLDDAEIDYVINAVRSFYSS